MTPLERAAKALETELERQSADSLSHFVPRDLGSDWITVDGNINLTPLLRSILLAIREPGDLQLDATNVNGGALAESRDMRRVFWKKMIDAALEEA